MTQRVPERALERTRIAGKAALRVGLGHLGYRVKRPFLSVDRSREAHAELDDRNARLLFDALSQLRGTALKAAQLLSMEVELLPEAYRREFEKSCHRTPSLNRVLVRKVLREEFGQPPEILFAEFDAEAFAAASLGQVHAAKLHDGTPVAVKIQYPGIHVTIDSDLKLLRQLARAMPNPHLALQSLEEIANRLHEEVDYCREAANTRWFHEHLASTGVRVAPVIGHRCGARVLTTGRVDGLHLDDWLDTGPSQAARDRAAQQIYDMFAVSCRQLRRLHADPNPGNYLFGADGTIAVIDFGCVKNLSPTFAETLPKLLAAYLDDDPDTLFAAYRRLGMHHGDDTDKIYREVLRPFGRWLVAPLRHAHFDFAKNPNYTALGNLRRLSRLSTLDRIADEFIYVDRTLYGLYKIFERLGAKLRMRDRWL